MDKVTLQRRYDLDWLRVLTILGIFVFHCTRFFDTDDWGLKNPDTYRFVDGWKAFANSWGMPLILMISGASVYYALNKFRAGKYVKGLLLRLGVPLIVGIFTHAAFQVYLERLHKSEFSGSFFSFYPHYFDGMYGLGGNFAWMGLHLWYLEALLLYSLLCLPLFLFFLRTKIGGRILKALGDFLALPGAIYLLVVPTTWLIYVLDPATFGKTDLGGWSVVIYPIFFISSFVIISNQRLQERIKQTRWISLGLGVALTIVFLLLVFNSIPALVPLGDMPENLMVSPVAWCWLLVVFGFGMKHLNFNTPFLKYANEAALPFYILHQTVIIILGFFVVQWATPDLLKFLFILTVSFVITLSLYEFIVRRFNLLRFLFGMKLLKRAPAVQPLEGQVAVPTQTR